MDGNPVNFPMVRRAKSVPSRVVEPAELVTIDVPGRVEPPREAPPQIAEAATDHGAAAIDPTQYGQLRRKRKHVRVYRLARVAVVVGAMCSVVALACLLLGDRSPALILATCAAAVAAASVGLSWGTSLAERVMGYAVGGAVFAGVALVAVLAAPANWFQDEPSTPELQYKAPKRAAPVQAE